MKDEGQDVFVLSALPSITRTLTISECLESGEGWIDGKLYVVRKIGGRTFSLEPFEGEK